MKKGKKNLKMAKIWHEWNADKTLAVAKEICMNMPMNALNMPMNALNMPMNALNMPMNALNMPMNALSTLSTNDCLLKYGCLFWNESISYSDLMCSCYRKLQLTLSAESGCPWSNPILRQTPPPERVLLLN
jgi:hypothetical protein